MLDALCYVHGGANGYETTGFAFLFFPGVKAGIRFGRVLVLAIRLAVLAVLAVVFEGDGIGLDDFNGRFDLLDDSEFHGLETAPNENFEDTSFLSGGRVVSISTIMVRSRTYEKIEYTVRSGINSSLHDLDLEGRAVDLVVFCTDELFIGANMGTLPIGGFWNGKTSFTERD